jgi:hypothetical protein
LVVYNLSSQAADGLPLDQQQRIVHVAGVMPFVAADLSLPGQAQVAALCRHAALLQNILRVALLLPRFIQRWLVRLFSKGLDDWAVDVTLDLVNQPRAVQALKSFTLARTEFEALATPDWALLQRWAGRSSVLYAPGDFWTPEWVVKKLQGDEAFSNTPLVRLDKAAHAFCTSIEESRVVALEVVRALEAARVPGVRADPAEEARDEAAEARMPGADPRQGRNLLG